MKLTQQQIILNALTENKEQGLNSYTATYDLRIKQAPTRIKELKEAGYIIHSTPQKNRSVTWVLEAYPPKVVKHYSFDGNSAVQTEEIVQLRLN